MTRFRLLGLALVLVVGAVAVASIVQGRGSPSGTSGAAPAVAGPLRLASCRQWNQATGPQRFGTVHQLARFSGGPVAGLTDARGPRLDDQQAYEMLERSCTPGYARAFKLYKLYGRSAAFIGH